MQWRVVKMGAEMFDMLHAVGLAVLLAQATLEPVTLTDQGVDYVLTSSVSAVPQAETELLERVLLLPESDQAVARADQVNDEQRPPAHLASDLALSNLDGLLAALFTTPGVRFVSVADVRQKQTRKPAAWESAVEKGKQALTLWKGQADALFQQDRRQASTWLERLLLDYDCSVPALPFPVPVRKEIHELSLVMMLDPTLSYSLHREHSDGLVTQGTNLTVAGTSFAVLLAQIGAARFLRAQCLPHGLINCYVPLVTALTITKETALEPLAFGAASPEQAFLFHWLQYAFHQRAKEKDALIWKGVTYQTLQTQGIQQSFSCQRGCLDLSWLQRSIPPSERVSLLSLWRALCKIAPDECPEVGETLCDALLSHQASSWLAHLRELAAWFPTHEHLLPRCYRWKEVKVMTDLMSAPTSTSRLFQAILQRKGTGTLRIGRALRLLGRANRSALQDVTEELEHVQTWNQLNRVLAQASQECALLEAKTPFFLLPNEQDAQVLYADVEQSDPQTIATFLILLSVLDYPVERGKPPAKEPMLLHACTF